MSSDPLTMTLLLLYYSSVDFFPGLVTHTSMTYFNSSKVAFSTVLSALQGTDGFMTYHAVNRRATCTGTIVFSIDSESRIRWLHL